MCTQTQVQYLSFHSQWWDDSLTRPVEIRRRTGLMCSPKHGDVLPRIFKVVIKFAKRKTYITYASDNKSLFYVWNKIVKKYFINFLLLQYLHLFPLVLFHWNRNSGEHNQKWQGTSANLVIWNSCTKNIFVLVCHNRSVDSTRLGRVGDSLYILIFTNVYFKVQKKSYKLIIYYWIDENKISINE